MSATAAPAGTLSWAIRDSFLRYVTVIAGGSCALSGAATVDESSVFVFALRDVAEDGPDRRLAFEGTVHLTAHHGVLDVWIIDPEVIIGPIGAVLVARTSPDSADLVPLVAGAPVDPVEDDGALRWRSVPTVLLDGAVDLFGGVYPPGTAMAPFDVAVTLDS